MWVKNTIATDCIFIDNFQAKLGGVFKARPLVGWHHSSSSWLLKQALRQDFLVQ